MATTRVPLTSQQRLYVLRRDRFTCQAEHKGVKCGKRGRDLILEVDHIKPVADGGTNVQSNLRTMCVDCHVRRHPWIELRYGYRPRTFSERLRLIAAGKLKSSGVPAKGKVLRVA